MAALISRCCPSLSKLGNADDSGAVWCTGVAGGRANRPAARHERTGSAGPGSSRSRPHAGDLYVFRGVRGNLIKILWHDGIGMSLYAKRLEKGRFIWPSPTAGVVGISASQLAYMLDGIDWRNPVHTFRPERAG